MVFVFWLLSILHIFCQYDEIHTNKKFYLALPGVFSFTENPMNALHAHLCIQIQRLRMAFVKHTSFLPAVLSSF